MPKPAIIAAVVSGILAIASFAFYMSDFSEIHAEEKQAASAATEFPSELPIDQPFLEPVRAHGNSPNSERAGTPTPREFSAPKAHLPVPPPISRTVTRPRDEPGLSLRTDGSAAHPSTRFSNSPGRFSQQSSFAAEATGTSLKVISKNPSNAQPEPKSPEARAAISTANKTNVVVEPKVIAEQPSIVPRTAGTQPESKVATPQTIGRKSRTASKLFTPEEERYRQQIGVQAFINFQHELATGQKRTDE